SYARYQEGDEDYVIFLKFSEYRDVDGYYFLQYFQNCSQTHRFSWTYYPPQKFKILLYFPEKDRFVVSNEHFERYAFDSYFTANVFAPDPSFQGEFEVKVVKSYNYTYEMLSLLTRIILTIVLELAIALMFGFWERKQLRLIALVNVVTQIALNLTLSIIDYQLGLMAFLIFFVLLEIAVLVAEAVIYTLYLQKISKKEIPSWKPALYALTANAVSFALGLGLAYWIPGIF
ncbi:MAG: hypothetical protein GX091_02670, partial [Peptococcaceae bacterium]|nr:hypothetical protein [Peptococcaceae bacterium]